MDKEREAFDKWYGIKPKGWFEAVRYNTAWRAWRAAKAQVVQQWISVKDEMPEQGQKVLVFRPHAHEKPYKDPNYKICTYAGEDIFINSHFEHEITHWMPLPKPPTKECK